MTNEQRERILARNIETLDNMAVSINDDWMIVSNPDSHCTLMEYMAHDDLVPLKTMHQNAMYDYLMELKSNEIYFNEE